jgi:hypothetical protein
VTAALGWRARADPLPAAAATAAPAAVPALLAATAERLRAGAGLRVARDGTGCLVLGEADQLPWCPGVVYLGWEGGVLVPTTRTPTPAADLLVAALRPRLPSDCDLVAVLPWGVLATRRPVRAPDPGWQP